MKARSLLVAVSLVASSFVASSSVAVLAPTASYAAAGAGRGGAWCDADGYGRPRPISAADARVAEDALATQDRDYTVERARATPLGVIALVRGDVAKARRELVDVRYVASYAGGFQGGFAPGERIDVVMSGLMHDVIEEIDPDQDLDARAGSAGSALWYRGAAFVIAWAAPVPEDVAALAGVRGNGIEVRVVERPYSTRDLGRAGNRLVRYLDRHRIRWSGVGGCASGTGLELDVPGRARDLRTRRAQLEKVAGMRIKFVGGVVNTPADPG